MAFFLNNKKIKAGEGVNCGKISRSFHILFIVLNELKVAKSLVKFYICSLN